MEPNTIKTDVQIRPWKQLDIVQRKNTIHDMLIKYKEQLVMALPKHINADKLIRIVLTSFSKNPRLLECTQESLMGSIMLSAQLGLNPDGLLGEAYLIPYNNKKKNVKECQFMIGYRGYISLAYRSNQVKSFQAQVVYEKDKFIYELGLEPKLQHFPCNNSDRGSLQYAYAVVHFKGGGYIFEVMTKEEIETIRLCSKNADGDIWNKWEAEMWKKTVIRKLSKITPLSPEFQTAANLEEKFEVVGESQKNEMILMDMGNGLTQMAEGSLAEDAEDLSTEEEKEHQEKTAEKSNKAMDSALNMVKGKANGNGKSKKTVPEEIAESIIKLTAELSDFASAGNKKEVDRLSAEINKAKASFKELTGQEYKS